MEPTTPHACVGHLQQPKNHPYTKQKLRVMLLHLGARELHVAAAIARELLVAAAIANSIPAAEAPQNVIDASERRTAAA